MSYAEVNGIKMHYEVEGDGPPLLFLHGLGSSVLDWESQTPVFAGDYKVIACDMRGHGKSGKPAGPYSIEGFADDVAGLLDHLNIESAHVVGVSMGGMIALEFALRHPGKVDRLVLVNTAPVHGFSFPKILVRWLALCLFGIKGVAKHIGPRLFPNPEHAELRGRLAKRFAQNDPKAYSASSWAIIRWTAVERLGEVQAKTLILSSDKDYWPVEKKQAYADQMPDASVEVIHNAHHLVPVECPEAFNAKLADFLRG